MDSSPSLQARMHTLARFLPRAPRCEGLSKREAAEAVARSTAKKLKWGGEPSPRQAPESNGNPKVQVR